MSVPPIVEYYSLEFATQSFVPIYVPLPAPKTASEGDKPEWLVLVPK